jgi:hypothetical protein
MSANKDAYDELCCYTLAPVTQLTLDKEHLLKTIQRLLLAFDFDHVGYSGPTPVP